MFIEPLENPQAKDKCCVISGRNEYKGTTTCHFPEYGWCHAIGTFFMAQFKVVES